MRPLIQRIFPLLMLFVSLSLSAQYKTGRVSVIEVSGGGGWSTLGYGLTSPQASLKASQGGSFGYTAHVGYALFFNRYIGIGLGADISRYGANARLEGEYVWQGVTDTDGERYDHRTQLTGWQDKQEITFLEIPLALYITIPTSSRMAVSMEVGARYGLPISSASRFGGTLTHYGTYDPWGVLTLRNMPNHGFYTETKFAGNNTLQTNSVISAFLKAGIQVRLSKHTALIAHLYANYGITNAITAANERGEIGWRNDRAGMERAHYFMQPYTSILDTELASESTHNIGIGAEIGLRFRIPHTHSYPCKCYGVWW